ncbi:NAD(P)/FAD-dependent oxidoreductase [Clostridium sp. 19966]|uniref:NAD(P)/FAD-dependent oxidoreductase n=1 Tax=Clostridium sp. 19966 TaxID=2768166 RepID=UPI0028DFF087|nr:NAD(P)/FAD-dependent oxidoreductase [Clostridium sp. 19966]MDT8716383.1 NAD(P)/FAD-dependent oxidoreductase [Clostridium sp. 19966]
MKKVVVIGGGPAGMMAAMSVSKKAEVVLLESNEKLGKKLFITGKGRCNITNAKDISDFFDYIPGNPEFLYSSLYTFTNKDTMNFFESLDVKLKVERGDRVFPFSDKSSDIINAFTKALYRNKVSVKLNSKVEKIVKKDGIISYVVLKNGEKVSGDYFILTTGGKSYPLTGSTGDGYRFAKELGHHIIPLKPSLVPIEVKEAWIKDLQGLSLKNVELSIINGKKKIYKEFGEMLFTHYGISGPLVLSGSRYVTSDKELIASIDLKPALSEQELDKRVQKDFLEFKNKDIKNSLNELLPQKIIIPVIHKSGIDENKKINSITKLERKNLVNAIKHFTLSISGLRPIEEAIVTAGGVDINEIDAHTMQSTLVKNLYFAGEVIDVDAYTGGYNIQIALSTGFMAAKSILDKIASL